MKTKHDGKQKNAFQSSSVSWESVVWKLPLKSAKQKLEIKKLHWKIVFSEEN